MPLDPPPLIELKEISKSYKLGNQKFLALDNINIKVQRGETLAIIGESGSGKSTIGKIMLQLEKQTAGSVYYDSKNLQFHSKSEIWQLTRKMQMIFQDPYASLNPRMTIENIIGEGIDIHKIGDRRQKIRNLISEVNLEENMLHRYPHEFSGGQRQRIGIARALAVDPEFIVCDEPLSALDIRTQKHIMQLLLELKAAKNLTLIFISHDLHSVLEIADHIAVVHSGKIVEYGSAKAVFSNPEHPYTQALLES